jgi:hypothetical protein
MKQDEKFGNIIHNGNMINIDKESIENLEKISLELKEKCESLRQKTDAIFKQ